MTTSLLAKLQDWYRAQCDGDWEHSYGVRIDTLDNPGWMAAIDLQGTDLAGRTFSYSEERSADDWVSVSSDGVKFQGAGGPESLERVIGLFFEFVAGGRPSAVSEE